MVFERLMKILGEVLPKTDTAAVTKNSELEKDLGINSLSMMLLALNVEEEFGFIFESDKQFVTVGEICDYIEGRAPATVE